ALLLVEGQHGATAKLGHMPAELVRDEFGQHVGVMQGPVGRAGNGAIRTDQAELEAELLGYRHRESVTTSGDQDHVDSRLVCAAKSFEIGSRDVQSGIDEGAIDVHRYETNARRH